MPGIVVLEEGIEGLPWWINFLVETHSNGYTSLARLERLSTLDPDILLIKDRQNLGWRLTGYLNPEQVAETLRTDRAL
jgi:hypothetical protein